MQRDLVLATAPSDGLFDAMSFLDEGFDVSTKPALLDLYYTVKPFLSPAVLLAARRAYARRQSARQFPAWPIEPLLVDRLHDRFRAALVEDAVDRVPFINFWPDRKRFAVILTHDVEGPEGVENIPRVLEVERRHGLVSSWNFVAEDYPIDAGVFPALRAAGCEIGLHGLSHDFSLFRDRATFDQQLPRIHRRMAEWGAVGFRSPATHRNAGWMREFRCLYDSSFPDTSPFEPQPGGCCSIWPYFMDELIELPITMAQDHTLFEILRESSIELWLSKSDWLIENHGLINVLVHPDYLLSERRLGLYDQLLTRLTARTDGWHALPRDVAAWWRARSALERSSMNATAGIEEWVSRVSIACARADGDDILFDLAPEGLDINGSGLLQAKVRRPGRVPNDQARTSVQASERGRSGSSSLGAGRRVLMLVQNQSLPRDRRVWLECLALRDQGFEVVAIGPQDPLRRSTFERREGIELHGFPPYTADGSRIGYLCEYAVSQWRIALTVRRLARTRHFDVVHAAGPPDFLLLAALHLRLRGTKLIIDQHDLSPELYLARFASRRGAMYWVIRVAERLSLGAADVVISTNESYRRIALARGGKRPDRVFVVRNGPDLQRFSTVPGDPSLRCGKQHLIVWHGMMAPQDGVDHALRALAVLRQRRQDWHAVMIGEGELEPDLRRLRDALGLEDMVEFTGWLDDDRLVPYIRSADIGLSPDPKNPLNDVSTMVKLLEYMAAAVPVVSYDLPESRISAGDAAIYAAAGHDAFADCIDALLDDPDRRDAMGRAGRARVAGALSWQHSVGQLGAAYAQVMNGQVPAVIAMHP